MEIVLLWLDELDDLVSAGLFKTTLLRSLCLAAALGAAIGAPALLELGIESVAPAVLLNLSLTFLIAWVLLGSVSARVGRRGRSVARNA
ncbi:MAG: hypothetical protein PVH89_14015 [Gammaproteobacteria bacterium]|jgi:hypothetical protein